VKGFPQGLNRNNIAEWTSAIHSLIPTATAAEDWAQVLEKYIELCEAQGVFPFSNTQTDHNDQIIQLFQRTRRDFVKFVDRNRFFHDMRIRSTHHLVHLTDLGFTLQVYAKARVEDPSFVKWLESLPTAESFPFRRQSDRYVKRLTHYLAVFVETLDPNNPEQWKVGYEINSPWFPTIPNQHLPSKEELERFILDVLWMPLIRSMRPIGMGHRLI
jgi:hypothetical protein